MAAYMTLDQRKQIETCLKLDLNTQDIADVIGMSERTVRREIKRGTIMLYDTELKEYPCYCPDYAQSLADEASKRKGRKCKLADDPDFCVRSSVAENPSASGRVLRKLAHDIDARKRVSVNPSTPAEVLTILATCDDWGIHCHVASHPSTPTDTLWNLYRNDHRNIKWSLGVNPSAPIEMLEQLSGMRPSSTGSFFSKLFGK